MEINRLEGIIESILFTMGDSVELSKIALAIGHDEDTTRRIIHCTTDKDQWRRRAWREDHRTGRLAFKCAPRQKVMNI